METGAGLLGEWHNKCGLANFSLTDEVFEMFTSGGHFFESNQDLNLGEAYSIHLYNCELYQKDKNAMFPEDCIFEKLKKRYL